MKQFKSLVGPYCFWLFVFTIVPMLLILTYAFVEKGNSVTTFTDCGSGLVGDAIITKAGSTDG